MGVRIVDYITNNLQTAVPLGIMVVVLGVLWIVVGVFRSESRRGQHWLARGAVTRLFGCVMTVVVFVLALALLLGAFVVTRAYYLSSGH